MSAPDPNRFPGLAEADITQGRLTKVTFQSSTDSTV